MDKIVVYGADWCPLTQRAVDHLRRRGIAHEYVDVEQDRQASEWVKAQNGGKELKPTIDIGGRVLAEPTNDELDRVLDEKK